MTVVTDNRAVGRRARRRAETRTRIIDAALRLFDASGVEGVTVDAIVDAADIAKGTFFNYYPTKQALLADLLEQAGDRIREATEESGARSLRGRLQSLSRQTEAVLRAAGPWLEAALSQVAHSPEMAEADRAEGDGDQAMLRRWIEEAKRRGELPPRVDVILLAESLADLYHGAVIRWLHAGRPHGLARLIEARLLMMMNGSRVHRT